jgi:hypothetical protein
MLVLTQISLYSLHKMHRSCHSNGHVLCSFLATSALRNFVNIDQKSLSQSSVLILNLLKHDKLFIMRILIIRYENPMLSRGLKLSNFITAVA